MSVIPGPRPRLYFNHEDLPGLRRRFQQDNALRKAREDLLGRARCALTTELPREEYALDKPGPHGGYFDSARIAREVIETCSFAHAITDMPCFAERAAEAMAHFAQYESWTGKGFRDFEPSWQAALETATFVQSYAVGIDWLGESLADVDRRGASAALARLGVEPLMSDWLEPQRRIHALDSMGHNWWMVCVGSAGVGAVTLLGEDERAKGWLKLVTDGVGEFFRYPGNVLQNKPRSFDPEGGFYESLGYTDYALRHYAYLAAALAHLFPEGFNGRRFDELPPELEHMAEFMLHFTYPCSAAQENASGGQRFISVDFGDHHRDRAFSGDAILFLANATEYPRYRWYFDRFLDGVAGPYQMLFYDSGLRAGSPPDLPLSHVLCGIGWGSLRDSWRDDATFLAVKCGDTWNHAHADAGSFVVYAAGEPLLIDSGTCEYGRPEYKGYYTRPCAHNVVLLDGRGPADEDIMRGSKFPGRLYPVLDAPGMRYLPVDATGPFANIYRRFLRHFLWLDDVIVLVDDLLAHSPGHFEWLFHGETPPEFNEGKLTVHGRSARLEMDVLFPKEIEPVTRTGYAPGDPDRELAYLVLRQCEESVDGKLLGVIRSGRELPDVTVSPLKGLEWIGARLEAKDRRWDVYCNLRADGRRMHRNSNIEMNGWQTDAWLVAATPDDPKRLLMVGGSYLRTDGGKVVFDCLSKCNVALSVRRDDGVAGVVLQTPRGSRVRIGSARRPDSVIVNGCVLNSDAVIQEGAQSVFIAPV